MLWSSRTINKLGYEVLYDIFPKDISKMALKYPQRKIQPKPKVSKSNRKKQLTSGIIENFHRRYRQFKEQHHFEPHREPTPSIVSEWINDGKTSKSVRHGWAKELLEKHKPKDGDE